jgi:PEP-CTERM motif
MKSFSKMLVLPLTIVAFAVAATAAKANPYALTIVLDSPFQVGVGGQTLNFTGTITDPATTGVPLGGDSFTLAGSFTTNDSGFQNNAPFTMNIGDSSGDINLFTITVAPGTPAGIYAGVFDILNGNMVVGEVDFDIDVTPEPGTILLLGTGLLLLAGLARRRMPKPATMTVA